MTDEQLMVGMYHRFKRTPPEGTISSAISAHNQACGMIGYLFCVHPDVVATAVANSKMPRES